MAVIDKYHNNRIALLRRGTALNGVSIDCSFPAVEYFLCSIVPEYCQQEELLSSISCQVYGLNRRVKHHGAISCQEDLMNAIAALEEFLNVCDQLPATITFDVHTYIGQIKALQNDKSGAVQSFTRALWIASCSEDIPQEYVATTLHRMGQVHAKGGNIVEARGILNKALETYKAANVVSNHPLVANAKRLSEEVDQKYRESPESWSSMLRSSAKARLAAILE